jgi:DNA repair photolyase
MRGWGAGSTLMFSMLTDGFSPHLVTQGITRAVLELLVERTAFRIRVLTKNAIVGSSEWVEFLLKHKYRFVVGLSTGTLDDEWARAVEIGTSAPSARLRSLRALQDAGVTTFGMACPIFPDVVASDRLDALIDQIRPQKVETLWAEPFNDRLNWERVRAGYAPSSAGYGWFTRVFQDGDKKAWSKYATDLYVRLRLRAEADGWIEKLKFMLYERGIVSADARRFCSMDGLMLQSPAGDDGRSKNPHIRAVQEMIGSPSAWDRVASDHSVLDAREDDEDDE